MIVYNRCHKPTDQVKSGLIVLQSEFLVRDKFVDGDYRYANGIRDYSKVDVLISMGKSH